MNLSTDDFANRELSFEELDAVSAGWPHWVHTVVNDVEHFFQNPTVLKVLAVGTAIVGSIFSSWVNKKLN